MTALAKRGPYCPLGSRTAREAGERIRGGEPIETVAAELKRTPAQLRRSLRAWGIRVTVPGRQPWVTTLPHPAKAPLAPRITTRPYDDPKAAIRAIERQRIAEEKPR